MPNLCRQLVEQQEASLPVSIYSYGFTDADFDPSRRYDESLRCSIKSYKEFPDDLLDCHAFNADPRFIAYGNILNLATRHTNAHIFEYVNQRRPKDHDVFRSTGIVTNRLNSAYDWAVKEGWKGFTSKEEVKAWIEDERVRNRVKNQDLEKIAPSSRSTAPMAAGTPQDSPVENRGLGQMATHGRQDTPISRSSSQDPYGLRGNFHGHRSNPYIPLVQQTTPISPTSPTTAGTFCSLADISPPTNGVENEYVDAQATPGAEPQADMADTAEDFGLSFEFEED